jgi:hypothetical protein
MPNRSFGPNGFEQFDFGRPDAFALGKIETNGQPEIAHRGKSSAKLCSKGGLSDCH